MKKLKTMFMTLATIGLLGACSNTEVVETGLTTDENAVSFASNIRLDPPVSRVTDNKWDKNDAIGVFAIETGQELSDATLFDGKANIKHTTQEAGVTAKFTAESNVIALKPGDKIDVVAYYPYAETITDYTLPISVKDQSDLSKIDILYSNDLKALADNGEASMNFTHQLAQVIFQVEPGNGFPNVDQVEFGALKGLKTEGSMSLKDGAISLKNSGSSDIALTATGSKARAIVVPGQELNEQISMKLTLGEDEFIWTAKKNLALESGKKYTFRLQLSADGEVITLNPGGSISDWQEGNTEGGIDVITPGGNDDDINVGVEQVLLTEGFSKLEGKQSIADFEGDYKNWVDNPDLTYSVSFNSGMLRSTKTINGHIWFGGGHKNWFKMHDIDVAGVTNLKVKFELVANNANATKANVISLKVNDVELESLPDEFLDGMGKYKVYTLDIPIDSDKITIEFTGDLTEATQGVRLDNIEISGVK